ncbi:5'-3' exonuclease [Mycoplasma phocimorsus]|uniref:5'-3' exonuclease n=1 Tax=Mycoplasma phocimorsus TaxID=3045839 RepID=UPI0024C0719A|nr:5'-3' exonuclease H3TH domain-containing protein [Mycoplasma phocimorsus]MDJ1648152.1 5'-3' exonuclease H3TH domain-containing protein [Mycoplasma phocimorsus]
MEKKVLLVDGNLMMFKSFHATNRPGANQWIYNGIHIGGVRVFLSTLISIIEYINPTHLLIAFDSHAKTFRHNAYDQYKAGRGDVDISIFHQFDDIKVILKGLNIKCCEIPGFEADDIIASTYKLFDENDRIYIYSSDKDMYQMLEYKNVEIFFKNPKNKEYLHLNSNNFYDYFGINGDQIVDFKAIAGDSSDNLPGIKGIGPTTAIKLLNKYGSLANIYLHINELTKSQQEKFLTDKDKANQYKYLAQLIYNINFNFLETNLKLKIKNFKDQEYITKYCLENILKKYAKLNN